MSNQQDNTKTEEVETRVEPSVPRADRQDLPRPAMGATPGPWSIFEPMAHGVRECIPQDGSAPFQYRSVMIAAGDKLVADALMWTAGKNGGYPRVDNADEQDANARIIAAAPELLAALTSLRLRYISLFDLYVRKTYSRSDGQSDLDLTLVDTDMAIAKAEGRS